MKVTLLRARQIFDSRGVPTIETDIELNNTYFARASVPSGASKGKHEVLELRDNKPYYLGKSVFDAVKKINNEINNTISGKIFHSLAEIDKFLIELDGTDNKSNFGGNTLLSVSVAFAKAAAKFHNNNLFEYISKQCYHQHEKCKMPFPMLNIINGGAHADNGLIMQEFMIVPKKYHNIENNLMIACEIFQNLKQILKRKGYKTNVGDEGGFAPDIDDTRKAIDIIIQSIELSNYKPGEDVGIALDVAANEFYKNKTYDLRDVKLSTESFASLYNDIVSEYPIISIEDPFSEDDLEGWKIITKQLGDKIDIVGDDIFVTNVNKLRKGIIDKLANTILVKINQIGTVTETLECIKLAKQNNIKHIISHRSGETEDVFIAHMAVATGAKYIKSGALSRTDRVCKYNELIRISELMHQTT